MHSFKWEDVLQDSYLAALSDKFSIQSTFEKQEVRNLLIRILKAEGGGALVKEPLSDQQMQEVAGKLLTNALRKAFRAEWNVSEYETNGFFIKPVENKLFKNTIQVEKVVHVNSCSAKDLIPLPKIGKSLAEKIVRERQNNGLYKSMKDLENRVSGLGDDPKDVLLPLLRFVTKPTTQSAASLSDFSGMLELIRNRRQSYSMIQLLEYTVAHASANNKSNFFFEQEALYTNTPELEQTTNRVGILQNEEYYYWLKSAIGEAKKTIDIAMFHFAVPTKNHPTRVLLNMLIEAKDRGVKIRVLLDSDREEDPYKSSIINEEAYNFLNANGVETKLDSPARLLHSKVVIIDGKISVVGSHNWSAGSYFSYDDVSLIMDDQNFTSTLTKRFNKIWSV